MNVVPRTQQGVLVIMTDYHLGDFAIAMPVIEALAAYFDHGIDLAVLGTHAPLIQMLPSVQKIRVRPYLTHKKARNLRQHLSFVKLAFGLLARRYRVVFGVSDRTVCANLALATLSPWRIGRRRAKRGWVYNDRLLDNPVERHRLDDFSTLLARTGTPGRPPLPKLLLPASSLDRAIRLVQAQWGQDARYAVIHATAGKASRQWPAERFAQVADRVAADWDLGICLIGGPGETSYLHALRGKMNSPQRAMVLTDSVDVSLAILRLARLFVCNLSGPTHVASLATDAPIVCIADPKDKEYTPLGNPRVTLLHGPVCDLPCRREACINGFRCVMDVTADDVIQAVNRSLGRPAPASVQDRV